MSFPKEQIKLIFGDGTEVDVDSLIEALRDEEKRVLANDELGVVIYVGDMDLYSLKPTESGEYLAQKVTQISSSRFPTKVLRKQIGATVLSTTADAVFVIRDGEALRKIRAEKLEPGMVLANGEKVFI